MKKAKKNLAIIDKIIKDSQEEASKIMDRVKPTLDWASKICKEKQTEIENLIKNRSDKQEVFLIRDNNHKSAGLSSVKNTIYLTNEGDLYKKPKEKHCYSMQTAKIRLEILKYLVGHPDYIQAPDLKEYAGSASYKAIREHIRAINRNASSRAGIEKLIEARQGSGYRINPKFIIRTE